MVLYKLVNLSTIIDDLDYAYEDSKTNKDEKALILKGEVFTKIQSDKLQLDKLMEIGSRV